MRAGNSSSAPPPQRLSAAAATFPAPEDAREPSSDSSRYDGSENDDADRFETKSSDQRVDSAFKATARVAVSCVACVGRAARDFRDFALFGSFVEIAVAFMVAVVFESLVSAFVSAFITPIIGMIGGSSFDNLKFTVNESEFQYGLFIDAFLSFLITMAVVFFFIVQPSRTLLRKLNPAQLKRCCPFCLSNIPARAQFCKFCTKEVPPIVNPEKELIHDENFAAQLEPM